MFNLNKFLWKKRITKKECARGARISEPTLRLIEKGIPVSRKVAERAADFLECSVGSLVDPK